MRRNITAAALVSFGLETLGGQSAATPLSFEVASIRPTVADSHGAAFRGLPDGGFQATGATLRSLMTFAYNVRDFQISGGPGWAGSDRYDIVAKPAQTAAVGSRQDQLRERVRALLEERFHLAIHRETKEQSLYALVGKSGSKLEASKGAGEGRLQWRRNEITGEGLQMQTLAPALGDIVGRPVIDKTGLAGRFDVHLEWTPDPNQGFGNFGAPSPSNPDGPSIFTALQEQLGLRLESEKGPVDMIVIDRVEKPSEN